MMPKYYIGLGSNLGNRIQYIESAIEMINDFAQVEAVSNIYLSEPVDMADCENFLNAALRASSVLEPNEMLDKLLNIEAELGRIRNPASLAPQPRTIDLDILLYGDEVVHTERLVIPHPFLAQRDFALVPLLEIQPNLVHPTLKKPLNELLSALNKTGRGVVRLGEICWVA